MILESKDRLVVIGNGMAGARFVEEFLARGGGERFETVEFGEEPHGNYNRILLSSVLAGQHNPQDTVINSLAWYRENGVTLHSGIAVTSVNRETKSVTGDNGVVEYYDRLVFATGSKPFIPPILGIRDRSGDLKSGVFVFRSLDDCRRIMSYARDKRRAVVIGGGLLGLEAAKGLVNLGLEVHVVHLASHIMETQLDREAGKTLQRSLESQGIRFHLDALTTGVMGTSQVSGLTLKDGAELQCDLIVVAAGIRPNTDLAVAAGIATKRGVVVNDDLSSPSDPDIYAIGECAEHRGQTYGLVAPCWEQAQVLAERLTGRNPSAIYGGTRVSTKLKVMGVSLAVMGEKGPADDQDEVVTYAEARRGVYHKLIVRNGRLAGAILLGDGVAAPSLLQAFDSGEALPDNRYELLFPSSGARSEANVTELPDSAQICNCNGVSKGAIVAAVKRGCRSLKAVSDTTRAGTGCGSCKPQVQLLVEASCEGLMEEDPSVHYYVPGVPMAKQQLVAAVKRLQLKSVSAVFTALAEGRDDVASKVGLASLLKTIWDTEYEDERDARFVNDRVHANIQNDGTFSVIPRIFGGVTSADQLRRIADVADKYKIPMVKITGGQRIDLLGLRKEDLPGVWADLGMPSGHAYTKAFRTCKTCVGTEFCRYGVGDSTSLGIKIEKRFQGIESPHKLKLAVSGCPRNCAESTTKDVGAVAIEGGKWEVYVGGASGSKVRKGDVLCVVDSHEDVLKFIGRFMQYYREHAKYRERTYDFVERLGIARLCGLLMDDSEGLAAQLDADMQAAVDAYVDPWQERQEPTHPAQFKSVVASAD